MKLLAAVLAAMIPAWCQTPAGPGACAACHRAETRGFAETGMTRALESGKDCEILRANPKLSAKIGGYTYEIAREGDESIYTVSDGKDTLRVPIAWAFGQGAAGQTYLFERDGQWYESRVSYYRELRGLDLTMGAQEFVATNLGEAAGHLRDARTAAECFSCHATHATESARLALTGMTPGVQCERCHGDSKRHVEAVRSGGAPAAMHKLGKLSAEELSDLCGECHRTWAQIASNGPSGIVNVRFQPYRLTNSKCYDTEDNRIKCTACHDPHREVEKKTAAYDAKCLACHTRAASPATKASVHICRVGTSECVTCHMPRLALPGAHNQFTDHMIRVVKAHEKYPF